MEFQVCTQTNLFLISLDPSFTRTGICIIKDKDIYFETASEKIGEKQFENVVHAAQSIVKQLRSVFDKYGIDFDLMRLRRNNYEYRRMV